MGLAERLRAPPMAGSMAAAGRSGAVLVLIDLRRPPSMLLSMELSVSAADRRRLRQQALGHATAAMEC
jgi:hypothetical protein